MKSIASRGFEDHAPDGLGSGTAGPLPSDGADEFLSAFDAFAQAVRRARGAPPQGGDRELTLSQYALLQGLASREWAYVRELAEEAGVTASTATRILDVLERRGIVRRIRSVNDRRAVTVKLTTLGRDLLDGQHAWLRERQQSFFYALPPHEQALAPDLLVRLAKLIDQLAAGPVDCAR
jgi:DNA-binding MarR family transcriptional regulator